MKRTRNLFAVLPSLVIPVCLGLTFYIGLLASVKRELLTDETVLRYLLGHPVSQITVGMFLVGFASLLLMGRDILLQFRSEHRIRLAGDSPEFLDDSQSKDLDEDLEDNSHEDLEPQEFEEANPLSLSDQAKLLKQELVALPKKYHEHYLWLRLYNALRRIYRSNSISDIDGELKYLAELDRDKQAQKYSLVQILIWATPMLGFLGTVLGISQALGGIAVGPDNDFQQMMDGLKGSLYVAFDTTALALTLSMLLMFGQFLIDRFESQLLQTVDHQAHEEINRHFDLSSDAEPIGPVFEPVAFQEQLVAAAMIAAEKQTEIWQNSIHSVESNWSNQVDQSHLYLQQGLTRAIDESVDRLATTLGETIERADGSMAHRWEQWQVTLSENARQFSKNQSEVADQAIALRELISTQQRQLTDWTTAVQDWTEAFKKSHTATAVNTPFTPPITAATNINQSRLKQPVANSVSAKSITPPEVVFAPTGQRKMEIEIERKPTETIHAETMSAPVVLPFLRRAG